MSDRKRILLADDSRVVIAVVATALQKEGFDVETTRDGNTAYEMGRTGEFDLAVLDQLMPGMLGIEIIERWHEDGIETPVVMLSAVRDENTAVQSIEMGAEDFVRKPFRIQELVARIRRRLGP